MCRCEESGGFTVAFGVARQCSKALQCFRCCRAGIDAGGTGERCMGVAFSLIGFTAGDRHASPCNQRYGQVDAASQ